MAGSVAVANRVEKLPKADGPWPLPEGWCWAKVSDLPMGGDGSVEPNKTPNVDFLLYSVPSFEQRRPERVLGREVESNKQFVPEDALLVCKINPRINRIWKVHPHQKADGKTIASTEWIVIRKTPEVDPDYLRHFLGTERIRQYLASNVSGVGGSLMRVNASTVGEIDFPLAPLAEQRRIVERVDALFAEITEGETALAEARKGLDTFRRALLKAAITGELTKDWRAANPATETGHDLLAGIARDRASKGVPAARSRRAADARLLDTSGLPQLPAGWAWATVNEVKVGDQRNGISISGSPSPPGVKAMRLDALTARGLNLDAVRYIPLPDERIQNYRVNSGDLLISRANGSPEFVGRAVYVSEIGETVVFPDTIIRYPLGTDQQIGWWIELTWNSPFGRSQIRRLAKTTAGILKISQEDIAQIALPIPPPAEATEILRRVSEALAASTDTLAMLDAEAADAARLKQSILKAAFEGRLVPQDSVDESAAHLLARLRGDGTEPRRSKRGRRRA
jgi:type I restriction enzyme S subunit